MDFTYLKWNKLASEVIPELFRSEDGFPIEFYIHMDSKEIREKLQDLIIRGGGIISNGYFNMSPRTVLIVDDKSTRENFTRVSFKASYIIDSIADECLQDINKYIHNDNQRKRDKDYMNVIYFKNNVFNEEKNIASSNSVLRSDNTEHKNKVTTFRILLTDTFDEKDEINTNSKLIQNNKNMKISSQGSTSSKNCESTKSTSKLCSKPCSHCNLTASQNMPNQHQSGKHCSTCSCDSAKQIDANIVKKPSNPVLNIANPDDSNNESNSDKNSSDSSSSNVNTNHRKCIISDYDSDNDTNVEIPPSNTRRFVFGEDINDSNILSEEDDDIGPPKFQRQSIVNSKHSRKLYSRQEKEAILKYIIQKNAFHLVGGNSLWRKMEKKNVCPNRTWMSIQNHFKRSIVPKLAEYPFLTRDQKELLKQGS